MKLIFVHNPKSAGTTFINIAKKNYSADSTYIVSGLNINKDIEIFKNLKQGQRDQYDLILGHETMGLHKYFNQKVYYITYLRDPVEHFLSLYYYIKRATAHGFHSIVKEMNSINEFMDYMEEQEVGLDNQQTRNLADPQGEIKLGIDEQFEIAKQNVHHNIDYVFLSEKFDQSLIYLSKELSWKNIAQINQNVTKSRRQLKELSLDEKARVASINKFDIELYKIAIERHNELISKSNITKKDIEQLRKHRSRLQIYHNAKQPLYHIYHNIKSKLGL